MTAKSIKLKNKASYFEFSHDYVRAGTECFYNVWFMAIQGAVAVYPLMDYMLNRGLFTLFFLVLACTISFAVLLLLLFSWNANHKAPSPTQMIQAMRLIL